MSTQKVGTFLIMSSIFMMLISNFAFGQDAKKLVETMVETVGGVDRLYSLKDVEYKYTYHDLAADKKDVSIERYVFDGELSWAEYLIREKSMAPQVEGDMVQAYNGDETWVTVDGKLNDAPKILKIADFTRKTNYYWFTMMFKLLDPGVNYEYNGKQTVDGTEYDLVKITFGENVGDVQDTYVLYINPKTHMVDQFLYTVMDFNISEPFLMKVDYEEVAGLKLPTKRKSVAANWDGEPKNDKWTAEISEDIKFNNGFDKSLFEKPSS